MSAIDELYQELVIDHGRNPRNFGKLAHATHIKEGYNPLCGDQITLYIVEKDNVVKDIKFDGHGCAISMASASLMTEALKGKTIEFVDQLFHAFQDCVTGETSDTKNLGKLAILSGVRRFPMRVKCATLPWHTAKAALRDDKGDISTE